MRVEYYKFGIIFYHALPLNLIDQNSHERRYFDLELLLNKLVNADFVMAIDVLTRFTCLRNVDPASHIGLFYPASCRPSGAKN